MIDPDAFTDARLHGEFIIIRVESAIGPLADALGRDAIARTWITGRQIVVTVQPGLSDEEFSVTLYHEILEALTVASDHPPESVWEFNESDFERAGYEAHERFGPANPASLNRMLQFYGFREQ